QAAVDHAGEPLGAFSKRQYILHSEVDCQPALGRLRLRSSNWLRNVVDSGDLQSASGEEQCSVARSAPGVEEWTFHLIRDCKKRSLRPADIPGRDARVGGFEGIAIG